MRVTSIESLLKGMRRLVKPMRRVSIPDAVKAADIPRPWLKSYPQGIDWNARITPRPLFDLLDRAVAEYPDNPCVNFRGKRYRYSEIADLVDRAAKGFQSLGVGRGIKVGLMLPNCPYAVISYYAVLKAGGTVVNINPLYAEPEIKRQIRDAGICVLVTLSMKSLYPKVAKRLDDPCCLEKIVVCSMTGILPFPENAMYALMRRREIASWPDDERHLSYEKLIDNDGDFKPVEIDPEKDIAVMQYTGGTTGTPKGARLTHASLHANALQIGLWAPGTIPGEEKMLCVLPLFHAFGMTAVMNFGLSLGAEMILIPRFKTAEVIKAIDHDRPTIFIGVPTMFSALNEARDTDRYDLSSLKYCISGGAPLPGEIQRKFERLTGCTLAEGYGLSEASPVCTVNPLEGLNKVGSVGQPLPGTVIEIIDPENPDRHMAIGERGEICVSGPQVMAGYANRAQETADALSGGRLHTGDIGYIDEDGYVYVVDRIKDLILSGGFNVYPGMVEKAIYLHHAVEEVTVCGVPDHHRGEVIKAFVKLRPGESLKASELRAFLKDKLAQFELPRKIEFRDKLPRTLVGKLSKKELIEEEKAKME